MADLGLSILALFGGFLMLGSNSGWINRTIDVTSTLYLCSCRHRFLPCHSTWIVIVYGMIRLRGLLVGQDRVRVEQLERGKSSSRPLFRRVSTRNCDRHGSDTAWSMIGPPHPRPAGRWTLDERMKREVVIFACPVREPWGYLIRSFVEDDCGQACDRRCGARL